MIADFGLSRMMEEEKLKTLTEICGTPGVRSLSTSSFLFCFFMPRLRLRRGWLTDVRDSTWRLRFS